MAVKENIPVQTADEEWALKMPQDLSQVESQNFIHQKLKHR